MYFSGLPLARRWNSSFITKLGAAVSQLPMREAVRYKAKNMKWTAANIQVWIFYGYLICIYLSCSY